MVKMVLDLLTGLRKTVWSIAMKQQLPYLAKLPTRIHAIENPDHIEPLIRPIWNRLGPGYENATDVRYLPVFPRHKYDIVNGRDLGDELFDFVFGGRLVDGYR